ncbi:MAG: hypothetical protein FWH14_00955 [Oscillospiraceae bacterium]|nr:hypothetical protein [Oscillospiraceae bacterium]
MTGGGHPYRPTRRNNHGRQIAAPTDHPAAAAAPSLPKRAGACNFKPCRVRTPVRTVDTANSVGVLASPFGRGVMR